MSVPEPVNVLEMSEIPSPGPVSAKPSWLSFFRISAMLLGSTFGCCTLAFTTALVANPKHAESAQYPVPQDEAQAKTFREFMTRSSALGAERAPIMLALLGLAIAQNLALLGAGLLAHIRRPRWRRVLLAVCCIGIGLEVVSSAAGAYTVHRSGMAMIEAAKATPGLEHVQLPGPQLSGPAYGVQNVSAAMHALSVFGSALMFAWLVAKLVYYGACVIYLRRGDVVKYYAAEL